MTICLATICDNGKSVILISDSMITGEHLSIEFEHKTPKIIILTENCAVATAGDALAHTELFEIVNEQIDRLKAPKISDIVECIKNCFIDIRQRQIIERILKPRGIPDIQTFYSIQGSLVREVALTIQSEIDNYAYGLEVLVGGVDVKGAHIQLITDPGTSVSFDSIGYHAIGSGYPHAVTSLIANDYHQQFPLPKALMTAYQAKKIAERAPGVGSKITNLAIITQKGVRFFTPEEVFELDKIYMRKLSEEESSVVKTWEKEVEDLLRKASILIN
ncbi:MAG: hypothetical protein ACPLKQ_05935 [Candidatus Bathyarchaeales archaeon]